MSAAIITIQGRLARDPELKTLPSGTKVLECSIPVDQGWGDKKTTGWYNVKVYGNRADQIASAMSKGMFLKDQQVIVNGTLEQRPYGDGKIAMDVNASTFEPILMPRDNVQQQSRPSPQSWPQRDRQPRLDTHSDMDSVPF